MKGKILFVVQRYGLEVNGGSELYCRQLAERMVTRNYDVSVITTCAEDYMTWENKYNEGEEIINGVKVIRRKVDKIREKDKFHNFAIEVENDRNDLLKGIEWQKLQGPYSMGVLKYIADYKENYDVIIFLTYLYFTTYFGLQLAPEKSILIPTAHDEPTIYYSIFNATFNLPRIILYVTNAEKEFVNNKFKNQYISSDIIGAGIDIDENTQDIDLKERFSIEDDYVVYVGRIDGSKGCKIMFDNFLEYKLQNKNNLKLVLAGKSVMEIPKHEDIINLGFISEAEKVNLIKKSKALILPSKYESLSLSTLEAMYLKTPVLLNGECKVLKEHAILSNGGLYFENKDEFVETLEFIVKNPKFMEKMGKNGRKYIDANYKWDIVMDKIEETIEFIKKSQY